MKKWQLGRVLTAKKHGKSRILRIQSHFSRIQTHILRIQTHVLRIQSHKQAHYHAQVTRLPRCKNNITAARKWSAHAAVIYKNYDVNNILVLRNAFEKTRKQIYATVQHRQILPSVAHKRLWGKTSLRQAAETCRLYSRQERFRVQGFWAKSKPQLTQTAFTINIGDEVKKVWIPNSVKDVLMRFRFQRIII